MLAPRMMDTCTECSNWRGLLCSISAASLFSGSSGLGSCSGRFRFRFRSSLNGAGCSAASPPLPCSAGPPGWDPGRRCKGRRQLTSKYTAAKPVQGTVRCLWAPKASWFTMPM